MTTPRKPQFPDATELLRQLRGGERSPVEVVREQLDRLESIQPKLNAATQIFRERALEEAQAPRPGPLSGLPVTVKETYGLAGETITAGSLRMPPIPCAADAVVVQKLRAAGAIVLARSNVPEFAMTAETTNPRYGRTNNALDPARVAGGSTGGEGALVASGASPVGLGSDILGSIRFPAAFNGIVGFKPHSGAVDKTGTWPVVNGFTGSWNCLGPLTRSVRDARLIYNVIARQALAQSPALPTGLRLIIPRGFPLRYKDGCIRTAVEDAERALVEAGLRCQEHAFADIARLFLKVPGAILHDSYHDWLRMMTRANGEKLTVGAELLRQLTGRGTIDGGFFMWLLMGWVPGPLTRPWSAAAAQKISDVFLEARARYRGILGADGILLLPTVGHLAPKHGQMNRWSMRPGLNGCLTAMTFCNYCDLSAITLPAWKCADPASGLPPAVMLACAPGAEAKLLDAAVVLEASIS